MEAGGWVWVWVGLLGLVGGRAAPGVSDTQPGMTGV